jgi:hypothetical protein
MEMADMCYLILKKGFSGVSYGKTITIDYIYNARTWDVDVADLILLYASGEGDRWGELGGGVFEKDMSVNIDIRSEDKERYGKIKRKVFELFDGSVYDYSDDTTANDITAVVTNIEKKGSYVVIVTVSDTTGISEGSYVTYATGESGWVHWINGNDLYIMKNKGKYFLIKPSSVNDLSDRMKQLYRCVVTVTGRVRTG